MQASPPTFYLYVMTDDIGHALCVKDNLLSLAICKPAIRRLAKLGDLVFGVSSVRLDRSRLLHCFRVTEILESPRYYEEAKYVARIDCIWRRDENALPVHKGKEFSPEHLDKPKYLRDDVGERWQAARVLLSDAPNFSYFGRNGTKELFRGFPALNDLLPKLQVGHRPYRPGDGPLYAEGFSLFDKLCAQFPPGVNGPPSQSFTGEVLKVKTKSP
jgi:hypothetical protein